MGMITAFFQVDGICSDHQISFMRTRNIEQLLHPTWLLWSLRGPSQFPFFSEGTVEGTIRLLDVVIGQLGLSTQSLESLIKNLGFLPRRFIFEIGGCILPHSAFIRCLTSRFSSMVLEVDVSSVSALQPGLIRDPWMGSVPDGKQSNVQRWPWWFLFLLHQCHLQDSRFKIQDFY